MNIIKNICSVKIPENLPSKILIVLIDDNDDDDKYFILKRNTKNTLTVLTEPEMSEFSVRIFKRKDDCDICFLWLDSEITDFEAESFSSWIENICKKLHCNIIISKEKNRCVLTLR